MIDFNKKVLLIGFGSVGRCALPILVKHLGVPYKKITVVDFVDKKRELKPWIKRGLRYAQERITPINVYKILSKYMSPGGLIVDLSWNIDSLDMLSWCHDNKVLYVNTSIEEWDPYANIEKKSPVEKSLYHKHMELRSMISKWDGSTTAVLDHGANPGLISHFTKKGLVDIARKAVSDKTTPRALAKILEHLAQEKKFANLAMALGVKVIHISERDSQISSKPKQHDEFVGTWSIEGLREEGTSPSELGWGTHEKVIPIPATLPDYGPKNQIFLSQMGINTWVRSWVPHQEIVGMVIRHGEAFSISDRLTVWRNGKAVYRPTVNYAYMPCDETLLSLYELRCRNYELQSKFRVLSDDISSGSDVLGALIMGHKYKSWWTGSMLSIEESRRLVPHQNATTMQVAIGAIAAAVWAIDNPSKGVCLPEDLPYEYILKISRPFLGTLVSEQSDWTPFTNYKIFFKENPTAYLDELNPWCFSNFLFKH